MAWLLKGRHHHQNPKQKEERGEDCSTCALTRHIILNLRNRNYSNEGMCCIFPRKEEKVKKRGGECGCQGYSTAYLKPEKKLCKKMGSGENQLMAQQVQETSQGMKRRQRTILD